MQVGVAEPAAALDPARDRGNIHRAGIRFAGAQEGKYLVGAVAAAVNVPGVASHVDVGGFGDRSVGVIYIRNGTHRAIPVQPQHQLISVVVVPDVIGRCIGAAVRRGDVEAAGAGAELVDIGVHFVGNVGIGFDPAGIRVIGGHAPALVGVHQQTLRTGAAAPDVVVNAIRQLGVGRPLVTGLKHLRVSLGQGESADNKGTDLLINHVIPSHGLNQENTGA